MKSKRLIKTTLLLSFILHGASITHGQQIPAINITIANNPKTISDSIVLRIINTTNDSVKISTDLFINYYHNDSLFLSPQGPAINSIFCGRKKRNLYAKSCGKTIPPQAQIIYIFPPLTQTEVYLHPRANKFQYEFRVIDYNRFVNTLGMVKIFLERN